MSWLRIDDQMALNRKIGELSDADYRALHALWSYCVRAKNDGDFTLDEIRHAAYTTPRGARFVRHQHVSRFTELGLVNTEDGVIFSVNDWRTYQPVDPTSAERKRRWRESH